MSGLRYKLALLMLAATMLAGVRVALAQEPYGKYVVPPTPVTGEPPWKYKSDPKTDAAKIEAVHLYVAAIHQIDLARADLEVAEATKATADPKAQKSTQRKLDDATKRLASARESLRRATELDGTCADCWSLLGYTYCYTGDREGAYRAYGKCLAINPNHFAAHEYQAESYLKDGRIRDALRVQRMAARDHLDRDVPPEPGIARAPDLAHAARAEGRDDFVRAEAGSCGEWHGQSLPH